VEGVTTYTIDEAAEILGETPGRVKEMLNTGELEGIRPAATVSGEWKVFLPTSAGEDRGQEAPAEQEAEAAQEEDQDKAPAADEGAEDFVEPPHSIAEAVETFAENVDLSRGDNAVRSRSTAASSGEVGTQQAARALGISPRTVRWHIEQGNLEARPEGEGVNRTWLVSIASLEAFRSERQAAGDVPRGRRAPAEGVEIAPASSGEAIRVLAERLEEAAARAAEYRVRLELTAQAESTLRAELEETRRRRDEVERERDELRRELDALRERRESPVSTAPTETPTTAGGGAQEAREATQSAAETLRGPEPQPTALGAQASPQRPSQSGRRRGRLWRRVFGG
jgi:hypothetical protein